VKKRKIVVPEKCVSVVSTAPVQRETPPESLGKNLNNIEDAKTWLLHPSNWIDSRLWIIKWDGIVPKIARHQALKLIEEPGDDAIFQVVVRHQSSLKSRGKKRDDEDDFIE